MLPVAETPVNLKPAVIARALSGLPQVECPVIHRFTDGVYIREMTIPAGTFIVGCEHIAGSVNVCLSGVGTLFVDGVAKTVTAPAIINAKPGAKMMHAITDVVWWNIFQNPDNERDIQKLEDRIVRKDESFLEIQAEMLRIESDSRVSDVANYAGIDDGIIDFLQCLEFDDGETFSLEVRDSAIEGKGLFSPFSAQEGYVFGPYIKNCALTHIGKYVNHAKQPNCILVKSGNDVNLVAARSIHGKLGGMRGEELTIDYRTIFEYKEVMQ
jgi:hypothetical protein